MAIVLFFFLLLLDTITVKLLLVRYGSYTDPPWYVRSWFLMPWFLASMFVITICSVSISGGRVQMAPALILLFSMPYAVLLTVWISDIFSFSLFMNRGCRNKGPKKCDKALALIGQERYDEVEDAFLEALGPEPQGPMPENAVIRLHYARFLRDREIYPSAVSEWEIAIGGDLTPDQCATAALTAADIAENQLHDHAHAITILQAALKKHPNTPSMVAVRQRSFQKPAVSPTQQPT